MGKPQTYIPLISLLKDEGILHFEIEQEGLLVVFHVDIDRADCIIDRLQILKEKYREYVLS